MLADVASKAAKKKKRIKNTLITFGVVSAALVILFLPYAITGTDGLVKMIAKIPMFVFFILHYVGFGAGMLAVVVLVMGGLGNAITGNTFDSKVLAVGVGGIGIRYLSGNILMNLDYVNPFTAELLKMPWS